MRKRRGSRGREKNRSGKNGSGEKMDREKMDREKKCIEVMKEKKDIYVRLTMLKIYLMNGDG